MIPPGTPAALTESHPDVRVRRTGAVFRYRPEHGNWACVEGEHPEDIVYSEVAGIVADYGNVDVVA